MLHVVRLRHHTLGGYIISCVKRMNIAHDVENKSTVTQFLGVDKQLLVFMFDATAFPILCLKFYFSHDITVSTQLPLRSN